MGKITAWQSWNEYRTYEQWTTEMPKGGELPWALFYPADYSIGASNLGIHYIYRLLKENGIAAERFFSAPIPYRSVDADTLLERFPVITAGISYEGGVDTFFKWLHGANIPLNAEKRRAGNYPVIGAGGAITYINPLLLSGVCDFIVLGDAMDVMPSVAYCLRKYSTDGDREKLWNMLAENPSVLVPSVDIKNGKLTTDKKIDRAQPIDEHYPACSTWITPKSTFGNTFLIELQRGCFRNCSYCTLPACFGKARHRNSEILEKTITEIAGKIKFDQVGLVTPEAGDYPEINKILDLLQKMDKGVSFASLRLDRLTEKMLDAITRGGRHSLTVAPETGRDCLRTSCGKRFSNDLIIEKLKLAKEKGINNVKLYFMIGLPKEHDDDIFAIPELCRRIIETTGQSLVISAGPFVPKPWTKWERHDFSGLQEIKRKYAILTASARAIGRKVPQLRLTSPKEAEEEFMLGWYGYDESVMYADEIEKYGNRKKTLPDRSRTLLELKKFK